MPAAVYSAFKQTTSFPLEIVLSDQGSKDRTFDVMKQMASRYDGPHKISLMKCRDDADKGMAGLNRHIHCIMQNVDADVYIFNSADDWSHADRTEKVVRAFQEFSPDYVGTGVQYTNEKNEVQGHFCFTDRDRFVTVKEIVDDLVGGSASCAWSRDFYTRAGPIPGAVGPDTYLPPLAVMGKGYYFIAEILHAYFHHPHPDNTGLGGVMLAAKSDEEKSRVNELQHWQIAAGLKAAYDRASALGVLNEENGPPLMNAFIRAACGWVDVRHSLSLARIPPMALPI